MNIWKIKSKDVSEFKHICESLVEPEISDIKA